MPDRPSPDAFPWRPIGLFLLVLGLFLTFRGYRSLEGDQAYRLPLLLHKQDAGVFETDPFVRAFDHFNPHRGSLALMDFASRPFGLMVGLALLFFATFALTYTGVERLGKGVGDGAGAGIWGLFWS